MDRVTGAMGGLLLCWAGLLQASTLTVCAEPWAPFVERRASGEVHGLGVDVLQRVANAQGLQLKYLFMASDACWRLAKENRVDVLAFSAPDETPGNWLNTRQPLVFWVLSAWVPAGSPQQAYTGLAAFGGQRVGWVTAYDYPAAMRSFKGWQRLDVIDTPRGMQMLAGGRLDVLFDDALAIGSLPLPQRAKVRRLAPLVSSVAQPFSVRAGLQAVRDGIDAEAVRMRRNGELDTFYRQHFGSSLQQVIRLSG